MSNIDIKLESWKNKLLDLGKRNKLLNYRDTLKSSIKILSPNCFDLYERVVINEEAIVFPQFVFEEDVESDLTLEDYIENDENEIVTNKSKTELTRVLRNLRNKAKTALEEQGVNMLYLSFGFLKWTEAGHSEIEYSAPLVLVPVSLTVESVTSPFVLSLSEEEITLNPTLVYKLESEFGISLPNFDENDSLQAFFDSVQTAVDNNKWKVSSDVGLSMLSFLKINMYEDLSKHKETILSNPIIRTIGGETPLISDVLNEISEYDFDKKDDPKSIFQIVDADSSQQEAILLAKSGVSFVLQGPPGTGKSQTITNIISESIANGKKVLFVSEKMAALEVVHKRLSDAGLDDFCLVLHSYKANKRNILDQLERVLTLSQKKANIADEAFQKLDSLQKDKQKLNDYAEQVFISVKPLGKTIFDVNGIIANLENYPDAIFSVPNVRNTTQEQYNKYFYTISQYANTIGHMTGDYRENPWHDSKLTSISNEFRHDSNVKLLFLQSKLIEAYDSFKKIKDDLQVDVAISVEGMDRLISVLNLLEESFEIPVGWILHNDITPLFDEINDYEEKQTKIKEIIADLISEYSAIQEAREVSAPEITRFSDAKSAQEEKDNLLAIIRKQPYHIWAADGFKSAHSLFDIAKEKAHRLHEIENELKKTYENDLFNIDCESILGRIRTEYNTFFKIFKKEYKEDKKQLQRCRKEVVKKISDEEFVSVIEKLHEITSLRNWFVENNSNLKNSFCSIIIDENSDYNDAELKLKAYSSICKSLGLIDKLIECHKSLEAKKDILMAHYQFLYNGINTNWHEIRKSLNWACTFKKAIEKNNLGNTFIEKVCTSVNYAKQCNARIPEIDNIKTSFLREYEWYCSLFYNIKEIEQSDLNTLADRIEACKNGMFYLEEWIDFQAAKKSCIEIGLDDFVKYAETNNVNSDSLIPIFKKRFYRLWLDSVLPEYPAVLNFRRKAQEDTISEFSMLDTTQFNIAKARIKSILINKLPSMDHFTNGVDEISILKKELKKQRKIMPIRKLFKAIPNLLPTLKPCLMMSPLSVSLFLEAESYQFDVVIFDEASQVYTENAIGAISRGKQVIIAGDSKQLPPTNFFQANISEGDYDEEDDEEDIGVYESILDEANMLPERTLQWHYRSRHESLIAFSNAKIYKSRLVTFPSNIEKGTNIGVEYIYVPEGWYDRGGRKGNACEAKQVAELVFKHFRENPTYSLGVIAFGEIQQMAIETELRAMRIANQEFEQFFSETKEEPFFVKSLENVQGDERDTIIFSIGYAKDASGVFRMQFGPLGKSGGERRLNVAITRAKYNVKLVGSIQPTDIDVDRITSEGPKLLKSYIDYAINGADVLENEITESDIVEHDSPFEESVYNFLDRRGYKVATQVGCSGYRIDMAVKHPSENNTYVLGIECDGAAYHSARTARERDRLRQDVLENMGWKIYRIWSTDWIKDPATEGERLVQAIENAMHSYNEKEETSITEQPEQKEYVNLEDKPNENYSPKGIYGFDTVKHYSFSTLPRDRNGYLDLKDCIELAVKHEYPIHIELLCQKMAGLLGNEKATIKIRREVDYALSQMNNRIVKKGDFIYPKGYTTIPVYAPTTRNIQHISQDEICAAMMAILHTCIGPTREALSAETARAFGFMRQGPNIQKAMTDALVFLISTGSIIEAEGKLKEKSLQ